MITNNFDRFKWNFVEGEFYFIQIIKRKKDNPDVSGINGNNSARCIKEYSIYTQDQLDKRKQEMIDIATVCNARIYIHPARRSLEDVKKLSLLMLAENIAHGKHGASGIYRHACGVSKGTERLWVVDLDDNREQTYTFASVRRTIMSLKGNSEIRMELQTKNGTHFITTPFDLQRFKQIFPTIDVHKNNPTILYVP